MPWSELNAGDLKVVVYDGTDSTTIRKRYNDMMGAEIRLHDEEEIRQLQFLLKQARRKFKERRRRLRRERAA